MPSLSVQTTLQTLTQLQECIPVGCVPPAHLPYPAVSNGGFAPLPDADLPPPGCRPAWMQTPAMDADPPGCRPPEADPTVNITLPQTSFAGRYKWHMVSFLVKLVSYKEIRIDKKI